MSIAARKRIVEETIKPTSNSMLFPVIPATKLGTAVLKDSLLTFLLTLLAVFSPVKEMCFAVLFLVAVDTFTGLWAVFAAKAEFTSRKLARTVVKVLIYLTTICVTYIANKYLLSTGSFSLPLETLIGSFIALTELKSILENLQKIQQQPLIQFLIDKIASDTSKVQGELTTTAKTTETQTTETTTSSVVTLPTPTKGKTKQPKAGTVTPIKSKKSSKGKKNGSTNRPK